MIFLLKTDDRIPFFWDFELSAQLIQYWNCKSNLHKLSAKKMLVKDKVSRERWE